MYRIILAFILNLSLLTVTSGFTLPWAQITNDQVILSFPISATFRASFTSDSEIQSIILEYGNEQQNCGEVVAKAFPPLTRGKTVDAEWTWEMRQSGSLPPGATLWWRWRVTDTNGNETVSQTKTATWLDDVHDWQSMNNGDFIRLHWYEGDQAFAIDLAKAAYNGLLFNETNSGLKAESPIDIYVYANADDLKDAVLYEPSWTGGQAFANQDIVILAISLYELDWGRDAIVHELTHVLVGHLTFSCLGDVPTWLNEGLAVYSEGVPDPSTQQYLEDAIENNTLVTIRSLSAGFSEVSDKAYLSYSQSYSITKFLIESYGQEKMTSLLVSLRDGLTIDEALTQTYGLDIDSLEVGWRQAVGASIQPGSPEGQPTAQPTPTFVPTIIPISVLPVVNQVTPTTIPTSTLGDQPETPVRTAPPLWLTLTLLGMCCLMLLPIGLMVLGVMARNQSRNDGESNVQ